MIQLFIPIFTRRLFRNQQTLNNSWERLTQGPGLLLIYNLEFLQHTFMGHLLPKLVARDTKMNHVVPVLSRKSTVFIHFETEKLWAEVIHTPGTEKSTQQEKRQGDENDSMCLTATQHQPCQRLYTPTLICGFQFPVPSFHFCGPLRGI